MSKHPKSLKCDQCEETFHLNWLLENHLKTHNQTEQFECEKYTKSFVLKWRLDKHLKSHDVNNRKFCHYFNNNKLCPYDSLGCMFRHETSS